MPTAEPIQNNVGTGPQAQSSPGRVGRLTSALFVATTVGLLAGLQAPAMDKQRDLPVPERAPPPRPLEIDRPAWARPLTAIEVVRLGPVAL